MKIVIDATSLLLPSAGVKTYLHYWLSALRGAAAGDRIATYPPAIRVASHLDHGGSVVSSFGVWLRLQLVQANNLGWRLGWNPVVNLAISGADVFHCSQHTVNLPWRKPVTATIFDFSCWITPECHTAGNIAATRRYGEKILKTCDGLIAISQHARDDAGTVLGIPAERIRVIYPGVAEAFFQVTEEQVRLIRSRYRLMKPYVLFVGCIEPRKNIPNLLRAFTRLREPLLKEVDLVIAGPFGWEREELRRALTNQAPEIRYLGYVPEDDMPGLFGGARAFAFPSFYEGFGLPVAQAMAAGIPVIVSDRASLPEVVAGGGLIVNPESVDELTAAMEKILDSPSLAAELARRGKMRAESFRWPISAAESLRFFHDVSTKYY